MILLVCCVWTPEGCTSKRDSWRFVKPKAIAEFSVSWLFLPSWPKTATHAEHATSSGAGYVQSFAVSDTFSLIHLYSAEAMRL